MARSRPGPLREWLGWPWRISLTARILFVNIIALGLLAGSLFYLDNYRNELLAERFRLAREEVQITAAGLERASRKGRIELLTRIGADQRVRLRLYDPEGMLIADSFELAPPSYVLTDPQSEPWYQHAARILDRGMDFLLGTQPIPEYREPAETDEPGTRAWPEIAEAAETQETVLRHRVAPDRTPVISAATPIGPEGAVLMITRNDKDITQNIRDARGTLAIIVGAALFISILLSLFLARTIVRPLRKLVRAAVRVRLGRDREVVVPRLPQRRDEIGLLARAISDMTAALRQRIDAMERFAADVAHELKNPLTSLRSALESLEKVEDPALRQRLLDIAKQDVERVDWLVTEIADASRIDAELSRTVFEPVDMPRLVVALAEERERRGVNGTCRIEIHADDTDLRVAGDAPRLERVLHNLLDNAVSFSPEQATIEVELAREGPLVVIAVSDHGSGIPADSRDKIFDRFHSLRPEDEGFGKHSGLGLSIARTIVEAHYGTIRALDRSDGAPGARIEIALPAWGDI
jgi:two-component system, OmpR family, sensor histidine kinase ChvG